MVLILNCSIHSPERFSGSTSADWLMIRNIFEELVIEFRICLTCSQLISGLKCSWKQYHLFPKYKRKDELIKEIWIWTFNIKWGHSGAQISIWLSVEQKVLSTSYWKSWWICSDILYYDTSAPWKCKCLKENFTFMKLVHLFLTFFIKIYNMNKLNCLAHTY